MKKISLPTGLLVAATGVGAGDLVLSALAGVNFGTNLLWAIPLGALLKYGLNEGLARWELATGTSLLAAWVERLPRIVPLYFGLYLCLWSLLVGGTLIAYTGQAAAVLIDLPGEKDVLIWGALHSLLAVAMVRRGGFRAVETAMSLCVALMFVVVIACTLSVGVEIPSVRTAEASLGGVLALIGGVGGTLTILCYSYWLRERRSLDTVTPRLVRRDLAVAYALTGLFSVCILLLAAGIQPEAGSKFLMIQNLASRLAEVLGPVGYYGFLVGFWAAVFSSLLGVWSGVPYLFADLYYRYRDRYHRDIGLPKISLSVTPAYRWFLWYLAVPTLLFVAFQRPAFLATAYGISGAVFMPFLAAVLLYLNNKKDWMGELRNGWWANGLLLASLLLFLLMLY